MLYIRCERKADRQTVPWHTYRPLEQPLNRQAGITCEVEESSELKLCQSDFNQSIRKQNWFSPQNNFLISPLNIGINISGYFLNWLKMYSDKILEDVRTTWIGHSNHQNPLMGHSAWLDWAPSSTMQPISSGCDRPCVGRLSISFVSLLKEEMATFLILAYPWGLPPPPAAAAVAERWRKQSVDCRGQSQGNSTFTF